MCLRIQISSRYLFQTFSSVSMSCMRNVWGKQSFPGRWSPASHPVQPLGVLQRAWTQINTQVFKKSSSILLFQCLQVQSQLPLHFFFRELLRIPWNWWDSLYAVSVHSVYSNRWQMEAMHNALTLYRIVMSKKVLKDMKASDLQQLPYLSLSSLASGE